MVECKCKGFCNCDRSSPKNNEDCFYLNLNHGLSVQDLLDRIQAYWPNINLKETVTDILVVDVGYGDCCPIVRAYLEIRKI